MKRLASLCGVALVSAAAWAPLPSHAAVEVLNEQGVSGWEAVGMTVLPNGSVAVLLKKPTTNS